MGVGFGENSDVLRECPPELVGWLVDRVVGGVVCGVEGLLLDGGLRVGLVSVLVDVLGHYFFQLNFITDFISHPNYNNPTHLKINTGTTITGP